jgi:hypothetical protein
MIRGRLKISIELERERLKMGDRYAVKCPPPK